MKVLKNTKWSTQKTQRISKKLIFEHLNCSSCHRSLLGKNFVSDGHFCKSFCPASHKISISGDFRHCCRVMIYLDCVMSKNHDLLQNKSLRNRLIMAASVMEFISTTPKNELFEKKLLQNQPKTTNFINWWTYKYQFPVFSSVFQSKCSFGFLVTAFIKKKYAFVHH